MGRASAQQEHATKAETFHDSVGINVHFNYTNSGYDTQYPLVRSALIKLHIRHLREGLVVNASPDYYAHLRELGQLGFRAIFITNFNQGADTLRSFPAIIGPIFEGYEAPNEIDQAKIPDWPDKMRNYLNTVYSVCNSLHVRLIGPSLTRAESYPAIGDISNVIHYGNLHNYPAGRHPGSSGWGSNGYGSLNYNLTNVSSYARGLPVITTETGYTNDLSAANSVSPEITAKYLPRLLAYQYTHGIRRTYIYELLSSGHEDFGLLTRDGAEKPAYRAVAGLMSLVDDRDSRPEADLLSYQLSGAGPDVQHLLLQKSDGRFLLLVWLESSSFDVPHARALAVPDQPVTLMLPWSPRGLAIDRWRPDGDVIHESAAASRLIKFRISDSLTVVEFAPPTV